MKAGSIVKHRLACRLTLADEPSGYLSSLACRWRWKAFSATVQRNRKVYLPEQVGESRPRLERASSTDRIRFIY